jgi:hypothetical protein
MRQPMSLEFDGVNIGENVSENFRFHDIVDESVLIHVKDACSEVRSISSGLPRVVLRQLGSQS